MSSSKLRQYYCIGTNRISVTEDGQSSCSDGMLSLFRRGNAVYDDNSERRLSDVDENNDCLQLVITDGVDTFYTQIMSSDIKQMYHETDKTPLDQVADILLYKKGVADMERHNEREKYKISYKRIEGQILGGEHDSINTTCIKTSVLKTCFNSLVRAVWEGPVNNINLANYECLPSFVQNALPRPSEQTASTLNSSSGLAFSLMLGNIISKLQNEAEALRKQKQELAVDALRWKNTLDKLMGQWELEKVKLTQNFLTLFNQHKARHMKTRQKLDALTKHGTRNDAPIGTLGGNKLRRNDREAVPDDEDNHDYAVWDKETVERLAAGPKGRKEMANQNLKVNDYGGEDLKKSSSLEETFRNPHTGVLEVSNYKRVFDSDDEVEDALSSKKKKG